MGLTTWILCFSPDPQTTVETSPSFRGKVEGLRHCTVKFFVGEHLEFRHGIVLGTFPQVLAAALRSFDRDDELDGAGGEGWRVGCSDA